MFVAGAVVGGLLAAATGGASAAATSAWFGGTAAATAAASTWTSWAITTAVGFGMGIVGAAAEIALVQGGQIAVGARDSWSWSDFGEYVLNVGVIGGGIGAAVGGIFKLGASSNAFQSLSKKFSTAVGKSATLSKIAKKFSGFNATLMTGNFDDTHDLFYKSAGQYGGSFKSLHRRAVASKLFWGAVKVAVHGVYFGGGFGRHRYLVNWMMLIGAQSGTFDTQGMSNISSVGNNSVFQNTTGISTDVNLAPKAYKPPPAATTCRSNPQTKHLGICD